LIFDAGIKRKVAKGKRRKERPGSPWAEKIVKGMIVRGMKSKDSFRLIPLTRLRRNGYGGQALPVKQQAF